jgi:hypothetical protein
MNFATVTQKDLGVKFLGVMADENRANIFRCFSSEIVDGCF